MNLKKTLFLCLPLFLFPFLLNAQNFSRQDNHKLLLITTTESIVISGLFIDTTMNGISILSKDGIRILPYDSIYSIIIKKESHGNAFFLIGSILNFVFGTAVNNDQTNLDENYYGAILQSMGFISAIVYKNLPPDEDDYIFYINPMGEYLTNEKKRQKIIDNLFENHKKDHFSIFYNTGFVYDNFVTRIGDKYSDSYKFYWYNKDISIIRNIGISIPIIGNLEAGFLMIFQNEPDANINRQKSHTNSNIKIKLSSKSSHLLIQYNIEAMQDLLEFKPGLSIGKTNLKYYYSSFTEAHDGKTGQTTATYSFTDNINKNYFTIGLNFNLLYRITNSLQMGIHLDQLFFPRINIPKNDLINMGAESINSGNGSIGFHFGFVF